MQLWIQCCVQQRRSLCAKSRARGLTAPVVARALSAVCHAASTLALCARHQLSQNFPACEVRGPRTWGKASVSGAAMLLALEEQLVAIHGTVIRTGWASWLFGVRWNVACNLSMCNVAGSSGWTSTPCSLVPAWQIVSPACRRTLFN